MMPLHITQHLSNVLTAQAGKSFVPFGTQQNFCFAKTSFKLGTLYTFTYHKEVKRWKS
jgi:hypothetical protein